MFYIIIIPEWSDSIRSARPEAGYTFNLKGDKLWEWIISGHLNMVKEIADRELKRLEVEELFEYYLCCFYSDYERPDGTINFEAIQGPPWMELECPATRFGTDWQQSIKKARDAIDHKLGQKDGLSNGKISEVFLRWYFRGGGADEVADLAIKEVQQMGIEAINSLLWVCCLTPTKVATMVEKSGLLYHRFPQLIDWGSFALTCPNQIARQRRRAYPDGIDWSKGSKKSSILPNILGIKYQMSSGADSRLTLSVSWDPTIVTNNKDLTAAVRGLQKHYYEVIREAGKGKKEPRILEKLTQQKRKGGRPHWGEEQDKIAVECARLKDEDGLSEVEIANKYGFAKQNDSYGNLSQSSTARRYIKRGRQLRSASENTND